MPKFVVAPDSFKGSLTSVQAGTIIADAIREFFPEAEIDLVPMADGGEGTLDALVTASSGRKVSQRATGPLGDAVDTSFGIVHEDTVVIETANVAGLTMVPDEERNPYRTTTRGVGELTGIALDLGYRKFVIGLGGSATNDGGMGFLAALGARFTDDEGEELHGFGGDLARVAAVDLGKLDPRLAECELLAASDVTNRLCGPEGASFVFGPQKGATPEQAASLDAALSRYADLVESRLAGTPIRDLPGSGAAGGLGFALLAARFRIVPGAELVDRMTGLRSRIAGADWVVTGEGRSDGQSIYGKLPFHVASVARQCGAKALLISGSLGQDWQLLQPYFTGCFATVTEPSDLRTCMDRAEALLAACSRNVFGLLKHAMEERS
ncbi:glycerate kinase [Cohnella suwonensis]|uniref:Glycerate kinase n=1 Tax=Cohnella suwonensis TaxID=696072 RepID=A0ABW0LY36_9BACL